MQDRGGMFESQQPTSLNALIERAKHGDQTAFVELFYAHEPLIRGIVSSFRLNAAGYAEEDMVQEVCLRAYVIFPQFEGQALELKCWFRKTTWGVCNNLRAKAQRAKAYGEEQKHFVEQMPTPDKHCAEKALHECVQRALAELPEKLRTVVVAKDLHDLEYEEIATLLGVPLGTVQSRLNRGRGQLKTLLKDLRCMEML